MKSFFNSLMALAAICALTSCENECNDGRIELSHLTIECLVDEVSISPSTGEEYIEHTYLCSGYIEDYTGECQIEIWGNENDLLSDECKIKAAGDNTSFAFSFTTKQIYLDQLNYNFIVKVCNSNGETLCRTMVAATHPNGSIEKPIDVPYMEYSLYGTSCEWQLPKIYNNVIVANSDEELARYISSEAGESYPAVDFSKYTMIIAHGYSLNGITNKRIESFKRVSATELTLNITISRDLTDVVEPWSIALLVDKWDKIHNVDLKVDMIDAIN